MIAGELLGVRGPQLVHPVGERFQLRDLLGGERLAEILPHSLIRSMLAGSSAFAALSR